MKDRDGLTGPKGNLPYAMRRPDWVAVVARGRYEEVKVRWRKWW